MDLNAKKITDIHDIPQGDLLNLAKSTRQIYITTQFEKTSNTGLDILDIVPTIIFHDNGNDILKKIDDNAYLISFPQAFALTKLAFLPSRGNTKIKFIHDNITDGEKTKTDEIMKPLLQSKRAELIEVLGSDRYIDDSLILSMLKFDCI